MKRVAIIGAGAAGCFCAAQLRHMAPELAITLFEAGSRPMAKLSITGGGRCNLTNDYQGIRALSEAYPRGERVMKRALKVFSQEDTIRWFTEHGVPCVLQQDHCWFPKSQDALDVVRCLERGLKGTELRLKTPVVSLNNRPTAEANYFSQGFAKNQFAPANATPTRVHIISREDIGLASRRCLLCDNVVRFCMRAKTHTTNELLKRIEQILQEYELQTP